MKKTKRFGGLLMAAAMLMTSMVSASAASADYAPLDDSRDGNSSITIYKYAVEDIDILDRENNGLNPGDEAIDENGGTIADYDQMLKDVTFELVKVSDDRDEVYDVDSALDWVALYNPIPVSETTDAGGKVVFDDLAFGTYLIREVPSDGVVVSDEYFLVTVPMTNPAGNGYIYDVEVHIKNTRTTAEGPEIDKFVSDLENKHDTAGLGEDVTWYITAEIPADIAEGESYKITDQLDERLVYVAQSMHVYFDNLATGAREELIAPADYTFTDNAGQNPLEIELTETGMQKLTAAFDDSFDPDTDDLPLLTLTFDTTLTDSTDNIADWLVEAILNGATLDYVNSVGTDFSSYVEEEPEVHTGGLMIYKHDGDDKSLALEGAVFKIYASEADARADKNALENVVTGDSTFTATTGSDGYAYFYGLGFGDRGESLADGGSTTYWLVEIQAPSYTDEKGNTKTYNLLTGPVEVTVDRGSHLAANAVQIANNTGFTLPLTGGTGTALFTAIGVALIATAGIGLYLTRRKRKEQ